MPPDCTWNWFMGENPLETASKSHLILISFFVSIEDIFISLICLLPNAFIISCSKMIFTLFSRSLFNIISFILFLTSITALTFIPYSNNLPKKAFLRTWQTLEEKGDVFIWYDGDGGDPKIDGLRLVMKSRED